MLKTLMIGNKDYYHMLNIQQFNKKTKGKRNKKELEYDRHTNLIARANDLHACKKSYNSFPTSNITLKKSQDKIRL